MSFDAYVPCNCYKEGKTRKPPYEDYVTIEEDGVYLDMPSEYQITVEFEEWKRTACSHEDIEVSEHLGSNLGMASFRNLITEVVEKEKYSTLATYLPTFNGGLLPAAFAKKALEELLLLEKEETLEEVVVLKEIVSGAIRGTVNAAHSRYLIYGHTFYFGIEKAGFFIITKLPSEKEASVVFQSKHFMQEKLSKGYYKYTDVRSGKNFKIDHPLDVYRVDSDQQEFKVIIESFPIWDKYQYIIKPLIRLAKASVISGNPIIWT